MGAWGIVITLVSSWYLAGLSWTVLLVVYPAFSRVGAREWLAYHAAHARGIMAAVGPMWLAEAVGPALWLVRPPAGTGLLLGAAALAAAATVGLTAVSAVPAHAALADRFDRVVWRQLQRGHALRTAAWTIAALAATAAAVAACAGRRL